MKKRASSIFFSTIIFFGFSIFLTILDQTEIKGKSPASTQVPKIGNEIIYYIFVDRFYNGDERNDVPTWVYPEPEKSNSKNSAAFQYAKDMHKARLQGLAHMTALDKSDKFIQYYQGGDLEGVIKMLPYLKTLGVTAILLSPIFENVNGVYHNNGETAYHGYWTKDWFRIDEHFARTPKDKNGITEALEGTKLVKELIDLYHREGIKVMLDLSFNHTSPVVLQENLQHLFNPEYNLEFSPVYENGRLLNRYCRPTYNDRCYETLDNSGFYNTTFGPMGGDNKKSNDDPKDYSEMNTIRLQDWEDERIVESHQLHSLPDINQRNPIAKDYLFRATNRWLELGFDGFRIDAVKHIYKDFLLELERYLKEKKQDILLIGEYFDGGIHNETSKKWIDSTDSYTMFDFSFARSVRDFFRGDTTWKGTPFEIEKILTDPDPRSNDFITFINNHDLPRMLSMQETSLTDYQNALIFMFMSRGIPKLNYGDEIGLAVPYDLRYRTNDMEVGADPWCRTMLPFDDYKHNPKDKEYWTNSEKYRSTFELTKKLIALRKSHPALRFGKTRFIGPENIGAIVMNHLSGYRYLMMERQYEDDVVYFIHSVTTQTLKIKVSLPDGEYSDLIGSTREVFTVKNGEVSMDLSANETIILGKQ